MNAFALEQFLYQQQALALMRAEQAQDIYDAILAAGTDAMRQAHAPAHDIALAALFYDRYMTGQPIH